MSDHLSRDSGAPADAVRSILVSRRKTSNESNEITPVRPVADLRKPASLAVQEPRPTGKPGHIGSPAPKLGNGRGAARDRRPAALSRTTQSSPRRRPYAALNHRLRKAGCRNSERHRRLQKLNRPGSGSVPTACYAPTSEVAHRRNRFRVKVSLSRMGGADSEKTRNLFRAPFSGSRLTAQTAMRYRSPRSRLVTNHAAVAIEADIILADPDLLAIVQDDG